MYNFKRCEAFLNKILNLEQCYFHYFLINFIYYLLSLILIILTWFMMQ